MMTPDYATRVSTLLFCLSVGLFVSCLPLSATADGAAGVSWEGLLMLLFGWMDISSTLANFAWLANPALLVTWVLMRAQFMTAALLSSGVAAVLVLLPLFSPTVMGNEGGVQTDLHLAIGYWLWCGSAQATLIACAISLVNRSRQDQLPSEPLF